MKKIKFTEEETKNIINLYLSGKGTSFISKVYKYRHTIILNLLRENNVTIKKQTDYIHRKYELNEHYFEKIDTKDKAYFLGLLMADGNNCMKNVRIELQEKDKEILEIFMKYIEYSGKLRFIKRKDKENYSTVCLQISSKKFAKFTESQGIVPNKTHFADFPNIPEEFYSHFIRGVFDGDGSIWKNNIKKGTWGMNLTGNKLLIEKIQQILIKECDLFKGKMHKKTKNNEIYTFAFCGNKQVSRIREYLYKDCEDLFLTRKKEKFDSVFYKIYDKYCKICGKDFESKGFCKNHYQQNYIKNKKMLNASKK